MDQKLYIYGCIFLVIAIIVVVYIVRTREKYGAIFGKYVPVKYLPDLPVHFGFGKNGGVFLEDASTPPWPSGASRHAQSIPAGKIDDGELDISHFPKMNNMK